MAFGSLNEFLCLFGFGILLSGFEIAQKLFTYREKKAIPSSLVEITCGTVRWRYCDKTGCQLPLLIHADNDTHLNLESRSKTEYLLKCTEELHVGLQTMIQCDKPEFIDRVEWTKR